MFAPDPKWLEVFKLPLRTTLAVALAIGVLLALVLIQVLDLGPLGPVALPVLIILAVVFIAMAMVGSVHALLAPLREKRRQSALQQRRAIRRKEEEERRAQIQETALAQLDHLSKEEIAVVANALRNGSPTFYTYVYSPPVSILQGKRLVWTPGGAHHQDHYPFSFHDFAWRMLLERKDEFIAKDEEERKRAERRSRGY